MIKIRVSWKDDAGEDHSVDFESTVVPRVDERIYVSVQTKDRALRQELVVSHVLYQVAGTAVRAPSMTFVEIEAETTA